MESTFYCFFISVLLLEDGGEGVGISLTSLTPPCSCVCHKPAPGFPTPYAVVMFTLLFDVTSGW